MYNQLVTRRFRLLPHAADTGLVARGGDLPEAFANAAFGLFSIMTDLRRVRPIDTRTIEIREKDSESLLFEWLNNFIYLFDAQAMLFRRFEVTSFAPQRLTARCTGERFDASRHRIKVGVKSATYHMLRVDTKNHLVQVIFDV